MAILSDEKIIILAQKCLKQAQDYEAENRAEIQDDIDFLHLRKQWPDYAKAGRQQSGQERPMLVVNRLMQFRNQVVNEIRQNIPEIKIRPVDDEADIKTAEALQGVIRHISSNSNARMAYITAAQWQVDGGIGYVRVNSKYVHDDTDEQELEILPIPDALKVYLSPMFTKYDGSDSKWALIVDDVDRDQFESEYPDVNANAMGWGEVGDSWLSKDTVRKAEYFWLATESSKGKTGRKIEKQVCYWAKIAGNTVLDSTVLPISSIPIVPAIGNMSFSRGKRHIEGLIANAKDAQRALNFWKSASAEMLALAPKAPFIAPAGSFDGYPEWDSANVVSYSKLEYKPVTLGGNILPKPERQPFAAPPSGLVDAESRCIDDMKACLGIYDAALSNNPNQQSGKAVLSLQRQASQGTFHYSDNLAMSLRQIGKILLEWIPNVYDTDRVVRILGEDGNTQMTVFSPNAQKPQPDAKISESIKGIYNPTMGRYDVVSDVGPSYATQRQETSEALMGLVQSYPQIMTQAGDLVVKQMPWPKADIIADRLKKFLPPGIADSQDANDVDPEQLKQQVQKAGQQMQEMAAKLHELQDTKDVEYTKLRIDAFRAETDRLRAMPIKNDEGELLDEWKAEQDIKLRREELELKAIIAKQDWEKFMLPLLGNSMRPAPVDEEIEEMDKEETEDVDSPTQTYDQTINPVVDIQQSVANQQPSPQEPQPQEPQPQDQAEQQQPSPQESQSPQG